MQIFSVHGGRGIGERRLVHLDAYRIERPRELLRIGFKDVLKDPRAIVVIEWAERVRTILPKNAIWIFFKHKGKNRREIRHRAFGLK